MATLVFRSGYAVYDLAYSVERLKADLMPELPGWTKANYHGSSNDDVIYFDPTEVVAVIEIGRR